MKRLTVYALILTLLLPGACKKSDNNPENGNQRPKNLEEYYQVSEGLKDYFASEYFDIGMAIEPDATDNADDVLVMKRHCSSLTAGNAMKWINLQPAEGSFNYSAADKIVDFATANGMKVRGHTLCWHQQVPDWVFEDNGQTASKTLVLDRLRTHITNVVTHFKGKVYAWDVVNEAIDDGGNTYKATRWYNICGEDFIFEAFEAARQADPEVKLFYNDYGTTQTTKSDKILALLVKLQDQGLVDGLGMQGHWNIEAPTNQLIISALNKYGTLGIEIQITELDVSIYPNTSDPESEYTSDIETQQAIAYSRFFGLFRMNKNNISSVTFWGITDGDSWLNNWPVSNRKNYPLLFDRNHDPKKPYFYVIDF